MKRSIIVLSLPILAMMQTGCGTMANSFANGFHQQVCGTGGQKGIYPGVRFDARAIRSTPVAAINDKPSALLYEPIWIADLPLSAVVDTCLLPWDRR